jgi:hypothetical protein
MIIIIMMIIIIGGRVCSTNGEKGVKRVGYWWENQGKEASRKTKT